MDQLSNRYIPGVCNIGPAEIRLRKRLGWWGLLITIVLWALFVWLQLPVVWRVILFLPVFFSVQNFQTYYFLFGTANSRLMDSAISPSFVSNFRSSLSGQFAIPNIFCTRWNNT